MFFFLSIRARRRSTSTCSFSILQVSAKCSPSTKTIDLDVVRVLPLLNDVSAAI